MLRFMHTIGLFAYYTHSDGVIENKVPPPPPAYPTCYPLLYADCGCSERPLVMTGPSGWGHAPRPLTTRGRHHRPAGASPIWWWGFTEPPVQWAVIDTSLINSLRSHCPTITSRRFALSNTTFPALPIFIDIFCTFIEGASDDIPCQNVFDFAMVPMRGDQRCRSWWKCCWLVLNHKVMATLTLFDSLGP